MTAIDFYFDLGSAASYLAHKQLTKLKSAYDVDVNYVPMLLGAVFKATGNIAPGLIPAKGKYMLKHDIPRFVKRYNVEFKMNPFFPVNTLQLMRGCIAAQELGQFPEYVDGFFDAMWVQELNLADAAVVGNVLQELEMDAASFMALIQEDRIKNVLKENTENAIAKGVFGAPTLFIGDDMYFGQDRLDFIEEILSKA